MTASCTCDCSASNATKSNAAKRKQKTSALRAQWFPFRSRAELECPEWVAECADRPDVGIVCRPNRRCHKAGDASASARRASAATAHLDIAQADGLSPTSPTRAQTADAPVAQLSSGAAEPSSIELKAHGRLLSKASVQLRDVLQPIQPGGSALPHTLRLVSPEPASVWAVLLRSVYAGQVEPCTMFDTLRCSADRKFELLVQASQLGRRLQCREAVLERCLCAALHLFALEEMVQIDPACLVELCAWAWPDDARRLSARCGLMRLGDAQALARSSRVLRTTSCNRPTQRESFGYSRLHLDESHVERLGARGVSELLALQADAREAWEDWNPVYYG